MNNESSHPHQPEILDTEKLIAAFRAGVAKVYKKGLNAPRSPMNAHPMCGMAYTDPNGKITFGPTWYLPINRDEDED